MRCRPAAANLFPIIERCLCRTGAVWISSETIGPVGEIDENVFSGCCQDGLVTTKGTLAGMLAAGLATRDWPSNCCRDASVRPT